MVAEPRHLGEEGVRVRSAMRSGLSTEPGHVRDMMDIMAFKGSCQKDWRKNETIQEILKTGRKRF